MHGLVATLILYGMLAGAEPVAAAPPACLHDGSGFLTARLRGDVEVELEWREPGLACTGMPRPDGLGMRLRFSGKLPDGSDLAIVFAPPVLQEGASARAVPVNVTVLHEASGMIYGTRGEQRCMLDEVTQQRLPDAAANQRTWQVEARGFCTEPARALDDSGVILMTRFDFRGQVILRREEARDSTAPDS